VNQHFAYWRLALFVDSNCSVDEFISVFYMGEYALIGAVQTVEKFIFKILKIDWLTN